MLKTLDINGLAEEKCTHRQMSEIIKRNCGIKESDMSPEHHLILAIINQAVVDLLIKVKVKVKVEGKRKGSGSAEREQLRNLASARLFFYGQNLETLCGFLDLNPESTRGLLIDGGYLPIWGGARN